MIFEPESLTTPQLLQYYVQILDALRERGIIRTSNGPVGDYAEWLVAEKFKLTLENNSKAGYDGVDKAGVKYQIKGRRITKHNLSKQLSAIRNLQNHDFDFLIAVLFNEQFEILQVVKIPHEIIDKYARYREHVHAHILVLGANILSEPTVEDLTAQFRD